MRYEFKGKVTRWQANPKFFLVAMPKRYFKEINELAETVRRGWGSVRVSAWVGSTGWQTSIFPSDDCFELPLKASVRKAENIEEGDTVFVELELVDF